MDGDNHDVWPPKKDDLFEMISKGGIGPRERRWVCFRADLRWMPQPILPRDPRGKSCHKNQQFLPADHYISVPFFFLVPTAALIAVTRLSVKRTAHSFFSLVDMVATFT